MALAEERKLTARGLRVRGIVVSDKRKKTVTVQRDLVLAVPKYKRYARSVSKIAAHNPEEIGARAGDLVEISECRKISKTKAWIVTKIIQKGPGHVMPGQVKERDEAQALHMKKHGGDSKRKGHGQEEPAEPSGRQLEAEEIRMDERKPSSEAGNSGQEQKEKGEAEKEQLPEQNDEAAQQEGKNKNEAQEKEESPKQ